MVSSRFGKALPLALAGALLMGLLALTWLITRISLPVWLAVMLMFPVAPMWLSVASANGSVSGWVVGSVVVTACLVVVLGGGRLRPWMRVATRTALAFAWLIAWFAILGICEPIAWTSWTAVPNADWSNHQAWRACRQVIAEVPVVPASPPSCSTLHMCANEASFGQAERAKLDALVAARGCPPP